MRLWSICPNQLDAKGLVAAWREGLLAQKVLHEWCLGRDYAYQHHPQLARFQTEVDPAQAIAHSIFTVVPGPVAGWERV